MGEYIKNPVTLDFNPLNKEKSISINSIFQDKIARILWMGIKQKHLTNQYFNEHCLIASKIINKKGIPDSPKKLELFLNKYFDVNCNQEFSEELLPYLSGEKNLEYKVVEK